MGIYSNWGRHRREQREQEEGKFPELLIKKTNKQTHIVIANKEKR